MALQPKIPGVAFSVAYVFSKGIKVTVPELAATTLREHERSERGWRRSTAKRRGDNFEGRKTGRGLLKDESTSRAKQSHRSDPQSKKRHGE
jgi:hypothetical protein